MVTMKDVRVNDLSPTMSAGLFVEPDIQGYDRRNLAELKRGSSREQRTTVRTHHCPRPTPAGPTSSATHRLIPTTRPLCLD